MKDPRIITFFDEVNEKSAMWAILQLLKLDKDSQTEPINLYINSPGGSILHGLAIYDVIQSIKAPVSTVCCGMAASMGAFLLSCGAKGQRFALPHSRILIHQPLVSSRSGSFSTQTELQRMADSLMESRTTLESIMAENVGISVEQMHADCERDHWMSAEEALAYGLIDGIICNPRD
ncbi:MAG: ATP-dependent Clp protease proteolytic subunit [Clostridia bacterium]|nr:ATP-dependent Clp protease proteolytic subunit [Clostridia bacterium]